MHWIIFTIIGLFILLPQSVIATEVRVGVDNNPPLTTIATDGSIGGLLPELLTQIAEEHDWQLSFSSCRWQQCLDQLVTGKIDLLPAIAFTESRAKRFRFAQQTVITNWGSIYQRPDTELDSIPKLSGSTLAVLKKDVYYLGENGIRTLAKKFTVDIRYVEVDSYPQAFEKLVAGEVDAAVVNRLFGQKYQRQFDLVPTPIMFNPIQIRPAFSRSSDPALVIQFDQSLARWKKSPDSVYFQLLSKWLEAEGGFVLSLWWKVLLLFFVLLAAAMFFTALWARRQSAKKTVLLKRQKCQLEEELVERQQVEAELQERQQQYRVLFEESETIILLVDPATAAIVDANPAACRFYQYSRQQLQGMPATQINPLAKAEISAKLAQVVDQNGALFLFSHRLADGQMRAVEVHCSQIVVSGRSLLCSIIHDISKRKQVEQQLAQRSQFLQAIIDGVSDPLMVIDTDYRVIKMNQSALEQLPSEYSMQKQPFCHLVSHASLQPCDGEDHPCPLKMVQETEKAVTVVHQHTTNNGLRIIELKASPLFDSDGSLQAVIEIARDITERLQVEETLSENEKRLHHLAHHDSLTNLPNRLLFEDRLRQALSKARRSNKQVALFFLDLDHFKEVNDNLGHDFGDLLLIDIADRLRGCVRDSDTIARMGGDEFLILLDEIDSLEMVETMAERICQSLTHELRKGNYCQLVSASIGISLYPNDGTTGQELLKNADLAMYRAKNQGKATYQYYSSPQTGFLFE